MPLNPRITDWHGRVVWVVGASTGIGRATAERLQELGACVVVSARTRAALDRFAATHAGSEAIALDATDRDAMHDAARCVVQRHGRIDMAVYAAGTYAAMDAANFDLDLALHHQQVNLVGALVMLDAVLPQLLRQGSGHLSLVASVAGYRGLPRALAYGPTKAALIHLAEVLYQDLHPRGIGVSVVNPGFVRTRLTAGNDFHMPALIDAAQAASEIVDGWQRGDFEIHFPKRFTRWLKLLRLLGYAPYFAAVRRGLGRA